MRNIILKNVFFRHAVGFLMAAAILWPLMVTSAIGRELLGGGYLYWWARGS